jgi:rhombotail lipoprotein
MRRLSICALIVSLLTLVGCVHHDMNRTAASAPLNEILEPVKDSRMVAQKSPLALPASVAIVTVPSRFSWVPVTSMRQAAEELKKQLLAQPKYVKSVSIVSAEDVKGKVSLEHLRELYASDVGIILSFQQDQRSEQNSVLGLFDLTIVGAFLVPGVTTHTTTIVDGKVVHLPSSAMVFRSSGMDERASHSTTHGEMSEATEESIAGLIAATKEFGTALSTALVKFELSDLSNAPSLSGLLSPNGTNGAKGTAAANDYWKNVDTYKTAGGGAWGVMPLLLATAVCGYFWRRR